MALSRAVNGSICQSAPANRGKLLKLVVGKRRRLFLTGDDDEVYMTRKRQRYAEDNRTALLYAVTHLKLK